MITLLIFGIIIISILGFGNKIYCKFSKKARMLKAQGYTGFLYSAKPPINRDFDKWLNDHSKEIGVRPSDLLHNIKKKS